MISDEQIVKWWEKHHPSAPRPSRELSAFYQTECDCCEDSIFKGNPIHLIGPDNDRICPTCATVINEAIRARAVHFYKGGTS